MASYEIRLKPAVEKDFRRLPKTVLPRVLAAIEQLGEEPFPPRALKLAGSDRLYRLRVGDYRIIYETEPGVVTIHYVRHRRDVYRLLP